MPLSSAPISLFKIRKLHVIVMHVLIVQLSDVNKGFLLKYIPALNIKLSMNSTNFNSCTYQGKYICNNLNSKRGEYPMPLQIALKNLNIYEKHQKLVSKTIKALSLNKMFILIW